MKRDPEANSLRGSTTTTRTGCVQDDPSYNTPEAVALRALKRANTGKRPPGCFDGRTTPPAPAPAPPTDEDRPDGSQPLSRLARAVREARQAREAALASGDIDDPKLVAILTTPTPAPAPAPQPAPPASTAELLLRLREDPTWPMQAAHALAREFRDLKSLRAYEAACRRVWAGTLSPEHLADAYRQAKGPKARSPARVFMHALKRNNPA